MEYVELINPSFKGFPELEESNLKFKRIPKDVTNNVVLNLMNERHVRSLCKASLGSLVFTLRIIEEKRVSIM